MKQKNSPIGVSPLAAVMLGQGVGYNERKEKKKRSAKPRIHPAVRMEHRAFHEERMKYGE